MISSDGTFETKPIPVRVSRSFAVIAQCSFLVSRNQRFNGPIIDHRSSSFIGSDEPSEYKYEGMADALSLRYCNYRRLEDVMAEPGPVVLWYSCT
jgi:hypothetical protein